jgi:glycosyltransferase involved in cell wall biosynthesis
MAFLSRISPKKNLDGALAILTGIAAHVEFDIYGTKEDAGHWEDCRKIMAKLPANVTATYKGVLAPDDVVPTLSGYDLLFFPTRGENFGHVILESLLAGCPVLLSDQTPWRNLAAIHAGSDIALHDVDAFRRFMEMFAALGSAEFEVWSRGARELGLRYCASGDVIGPTRLMFEAAMSGSVGP